MEQQVIDLFPPPVETPPPAAPGKPSAPPPPPPRDPDPAPAANPHSTAAHAPLWLALHFPHLALEVMTRATPTTEPFAVVEGQGSRCRILERNRAAAAAGVKPGQRLSAAQSLAPRLHTAPRRAMVEAAALERLAEWAYQFSSHISLIESGGLLLEVSGSLRLYRGLENLLLTLQRDLTELGYRARRGIAPTPLGAWLLARSGDQRPALTPNALHRQLGALPLSVLELPADELATLRDLGLQRVRDCLRLPRDGLNRRLGTALLHCLDQALGQTPDPRPLFTPRKGFAGHLVLPAETHTTERLHFALHRLLRELVGVLRGRDGVVQQLTLKLHHLKREPTVLTLGLSAPGRELTQLQRLLDHRLERLELPAPVLELSLEAPAIQPFRSERRDFFAPAVGDRLSAAQLIDRLRSRLGGHAVQRLATAADHRPERAWRNDQRGAAANGAPTLARPLWLLEEPRPLRGRWQLQAGPERIESGWWDGQDLARDYFVAERKGARLWLFRELRGSLRWFLHGMFG